MTEDEAGYTPPTAKTEDQLRIEAAVAIGNDALRATGGSPLHGTAWDLHVAVVSMLGRLKGNP